MEECARVGSVVVEGGRDDEGDILASGHGKGIQVLKIKIQKPNKKSKNTIELKPFKGEQKLCTLLYYINIILG